MNHSEAPFSYGYNEYCRKHFLKDKYGHNIAELLLCGPPFCGPVPEMLAANASLLKAAPALLVACRRLLMALNSPKLTRKELKELGDLAIGAIGIAEEEMK